MKEIEATLNGKQEKALELMIQGVTDVEIAKRIGVARQTISNWRHYDTVFIETLEDQRRMLREKTRDSLIGLGEKAIEVLKNALEDEDPKIRLQAAKEVLNTAGLKDSMKEKGGPNEVEKTLMQLAEAMGVVSKKLGYTEPGKNNNISG
jgi:HEAT repeat protein